MLVDHNPFIPDLTLVRILTVNVTATETVTPMQIQLNK